MSTRNHINKEVRNACIYGKIYIIALNITTIQLTSHFANIYVVPTTTQTPFAFLQLPSRKYISFPYEKSKNYCHTEDYSCFLFRIQVDDFIKVDVLQAVLYITVVLIHTD